MDVRRQKLNELRSCYQRIRDWHVQNGRRRFKQVFKNEQHTPFAQEYMVFLDSLPSPNDASLSIIGACARELLGGCMEWSYGEGGEDLPLHRIAEKILDILRQLEHLRDTADRPARLRSLRNTSKSGIVDPQIVEVALLPHEHTLESYVEFARLAYSDVPSETEQLGGVAVLADTNAELEHFPFGQESNRERQTLRFRNARAMHLTEIKGEGSLVALARSGRVSILGVHLG